jgi:hypothetical protein
VLANGFTKIIFCNIDVSKSREKGVVMFEDILGYGIPGQLLLRLNLEAAY